MNMKKNLLMMAAILTIWGTSVVLTSCSSDDDNGSNEGGKTPDVTWTEPTTDQMGVRVTVDVPAVSLSQFADPSTGAALIKRLPKVTATDSRQKARRPLSSSRQRHTTTDWLPMVLPSGLMTSMRCMMKMMPGMMWMAPRAVSRTGPTDRRPSTTS